MLSYYPVGHGQAQAETAAVHETSSHRRANYQWYCRGDYQRSAGERSAPAVGTSDRRICLASCHVDEASRRAVALRSRDASLLRRGVGDAHVEASCLGALDNCDPAHRANHVPCVSALYHVFFQPLPSLLAVALCFIIALGFRFLGRGDRASRAEEIFSAHVSKEQLDRLIGGGQPLEEPATVHEISVLVCDIAKKYELAEEVVPESICAMAEAFIRFARDLSSERRRLHAGSGW